MSMNQNTTVKRQTPRAPRVAKNTAFMVISCRRQRELSSVLFSQSEEQMLCFSETLVVMMASVGKPEDYGLQIVIRIWFVS